MDGPAQRRHAAAHVLVEPDALDQAGPIVLDDDVAHHIGRVLRLRSGETVTATDGAGRWRSTTVAGPGALDPDGPVRFEERPGPPITIATAIPKGARVDVLVQKVTEIGADRIVLLHADRSVVRWEADRAARHLARLQRVADEACRQSRRVWRATVEGPIEAADVLPHATIAEPGRRRITVRDDFLAIGPEGGWTDREVALAHDAIGLGPAILRTETAAIVVTTLGVMLRY